MQLTTKSKEDLLTHVMCNSDQVLTGLFQISYRNVFRSETSALDSL